MCVCARGCVGVKSGGCFSSACHPVVLQPALHTSCCTHTPCQSNPTTPPMCLTALVSVRPHLHHTAVLQLCAWPCGLLPECAVQAAYGTLITDKVGYARQAANCKSRPIVAYAMRLPPVLLRVLLVLLRVLPGGCRSNTAIQVMLMPTLHVVCMMEACLLKRQHVVGSSSSRQRDQAAAAEKTTLALPLTVPSGREEQRTPLMCC